MSRASIMGWYVSLLATAQIAAQEVAVFDTGLPPSPFGTLAYDLFFFGDNIGRPQGQAMGERFVPDATVEFSSLYIHTMSNSFGIQQPLMTVEILECPREHDGVTPRGCLRIEAWEDVPCTAEGWCPEEQLFKSTLSPVLEEGRYYFIYMHSMVFPGINPLWAMTSERAYLSSKQYGSGNNPDGWQQGGIAQAGAARVMGVPVDVRQNATANW